MDSVEASSLHVGICLVVLKLHEIRSLKAKRGICKSVQARLRNRFNVSVAEVLHQDVHGLAGLGLCAAGSSRAVVDRIFQGVLSFLESDRRFDLEDFQQTWA